MLYEVDIVGSLFIYFLFSKRRSGIGASLREFLARGG